MTTVRKSGVILMLAFCGLTATQQTAVAQASSSPRQYYSEWRKHPTQQYHYRSYYYKPSASYSGYKHHYVVYSPKKPQYCYFYNPYQKKYWGRCHSGYSPNYSGRPLYSHLKPEHRSATLTSIPEAHFPAFAGLPPIPDSVDGARLELPPDDLPGAF